MSPEAVSWIAVDWGTSNLRAWAMDAAGRPLAEAAAPAGMGGLAPEAFEPALLAVIGPWLAPGRVTTVVACGMVGSRQGWIEAPYAAVPCPPPRAAARPRTTAPRLAVHVLPGLRQDRPADVMRGEETQIAGLLAARPGFDGVACLPGTHSKWAHLSAGEVVSFATFMTGELFALLSEVSVLRHSLAGEGWSEPDFLEALDDSLARPERLAGRLFGLRAESLLHGLGPDRASARLSGLLIGAELAAAKPWWLGREVALIGAPRLAGTYARALASLGVAARSHDVAAMTLAGLAAAHDALIARSPA
jgi:2-dehydro-3-deoxygalactonokinase